jgi:redox-sensitive bicupin YhaK (pirin superfamily)
MIEMVFEGRKKDLGGGAGGGRICLPERRMVGPFIFLETHGPADFLPGQGVESGPTRTIGPARPVTYLFQGEIRPRDNLGYDQSIRPGEVNWMTAGRGIVHSERTDPELKATGARMHGMQAWIALPNELEETDPASGTTRATDLPSFESGGLWARMVAGSAFGARPRSGPLAHVLHPLGAAARDQDRPAGRAPRARL